ncbi:hypothetical protein [Thermodesulfitimonas sp.]
MINGAQAIEEANWRRQLQLGVELLPVGDFSLYDHVLDTALMFGLIPARFKPLAQKTAASTFTSRWPAARKRHRRWRCGSSSIPTTTTWYRSGTKKRNRCSPATCR